MKRFKKEDRWREGETGGEINRRCKERCRDNDGVKERRRIEKGDGMIKEGYR